MSTITPNKTASATSVLAWQDVATATVVASSAIDVSTKRRVRLFIKLARRSGSAFTAGWPNVIVQAANKTTSPDATNWLDLFSYQMGVGASIANTTLNGAVSAGASTFVVTANTNIAAGDLLYLGDTSSSNWELVRVKSVASTTITPWENVVKAHANSAAVTDQAEMTAPAFSVEDFTQLRVIVDNAGGGQTVAVEVTMTSYDSDNVA